MPEVQNGGEADRKIAAALQHVGAGRLREAEAICGNLVRSHPDHALAFHLLGAIALQSGDADRAIDQCRRAIALDPSLAKAHSNLGAALATRGRTDEAIAALRQAIALDATLASARINLGDALTAAGRYDEAIAALRHAISLDPANALPRINLGSALMKSERIGEAIAVLENAARETPQVAEIHYGLGQALQKKGEHQQALHAFYRVRDLKPEWADNYTNLGLSFRALERYDEALAAYAEARTLKPDLSTATFFRALVLLGLGRFADGWRDYLERPSAHASERPLHRTPFADDLAGVHIFLRKDQGLGDELFFLRFAPELKRRGARLTYQASEKIASLLRRLPFLDSVVTGETIADETSLIVSIGDLPFLLGMRAADAIPPTLTLTPIPERLEARRMALAALGPPPYTGVTWRAGTEHMSTLFKAAPLERIGDALRRARGTLLALQRLPQDGEIAALSRAAGRPVHDWTALNDDLEEMLPAVGLLDDYVTVSNTNVHLRTATGKTSRVLVPRPAEFRWMTGGVASSWFPGCRVYRQASDGTWDAAFAALAADLDVAGDGRAR